MAATGGAEVHFAKKLANNDKTARDRAVKRLQAWIAKKPSGGEVTEIDLMKLWKGLFYCMWFSDKPLIQEELAHILSRLIHQFSSQDAAIVFVVAFLKTMGREWHGIDRLRLDKFYQLIRFVVREFLQFLMSTKWDSRLMETLNTTLFESETGMCSDQFADGVKIFFSEIFIEELKTVVLAEKETLPDNAAFKLLKSGLHLASNTASVPIHRALRLEFFGKLISCNVPDAEGLQEDERFLILLNLDYNSFANEVFEFAGKKEISSKSRKKLFSLLKSVKAAGTHELKEPTNNDIDDTVDDQTDAPSKKKKKKKSKTSKTITDNDQDITTTNGNNDTEADSTEEIKPKKTPSKRSGDKVKAVSAKKTKKTKDNTIEKLMNGTADTTELMQENSEIETSKLRPRKQKPFKNEKIETPSVNSKTLSEIKLKNKTAKIDTDEVIAAESATVASTKKNKAKKSKSKDEKNESAENITEDSVASVTSSKKRKSKAPKLTTANNEETNIVNEIIETDILLTSSKKAKTKAKKTTSTDAQIANKADEKATIKTLEVSLKKSKNTPKKTVTADKELVNKDVTLTETPSGKAIKKSTKTTTANGTSNQRNKPAVINGDSTIIGSTTKAKKSDKSKKDSVKKVAKPNSSDLNETPHAEFIPKTPVRLFVKKSAAKTKQIKDQGDLKLTRSEPHKKRVTIALSHNKSVVGDHLKFSPVSPFEPTRKPGKGLLKTPIKRSKAEDFF